MQTNIELLSKSEIVEYKNRVSKLKKAELQKLQEEIFDESMTYTFKVDKELKDLFNNYVFHASNGILGDRNKIIHDLSYEVFGGYIKTIESMKTKNIGDELDVSFLTSINVILKQAKTSGSRTNNIISAVIEGIKRFNVPIINLEKKNSIVNKFILTIKDKEGINSKIKELKKSIKDEIKEQEKIIESSNKRIEELASNEAGVSADEQWEFEGLKNTIETSNKRIEELNSKDSKEQLEIKELKTKLKNIKQDMENDLKEF